MGIKIVPHPPYSSDLAPCNFWLFPKPRGSHYETTEEMKEAVTKVINMLTQEYFPGALPRLLERYNKRIAAGGDYFAGNLSFMCVLSIKVAIRKKSGNLFNDLLYIYIYIYIPDLFATLLSGVLRVYYVIFTYPTSSPRTGCDARLFFPLCITDFEFRVFFLLDHFPCKD